MAAVGIDLGTTFSVVAVFRNQQIEIIANDQGNRTTPSCVAFTEEERLVGDGAVHQSGNNPKNTVYAVKRLIGRNFDDADVQKDIKNFLYRVIEEDEMIKIEVDFRGKRTTYAPEQISAMVLLKMKETVETYLGFPIRSAVITIPAYFTDAQREATKAAAEIAGLEVLRIINEPTAAALAYGYSTQNKGRKNVLIYDFGGGTFDVSIVLMKGKDYRVQTIKGDRHLGGEDLDTRLVKHFIEEFKEKYERDISADVGLKRILRTHCERAKRILSNANQATFTLDGTNLTGTISRARFEDLCHDLFLQSIKLVDEALKESELSKDEIHEVVLVGGSSRIPRIQELLSDFFDGKPLNRCINPDECVAYGAAIQAELLQEQVSDQLKGITLCDVCSLSLGVETSDGRMVTVIERNTPIPVKREKTFQTAKDNATEIKVKVYEGERYMCEDNNFLGEFELKGLPPAPRGEIKIEITFEVNANGILNVTALEPKTGNSTKIEIISKARLNREDTKRMIKESLELHAQDDLQKKRIEAMNELEGCCYTFKRTATELGQRQNITEANMNKIIKKCEQIIAWLDANRNQNRDTYETKTAELEQFYNEIIGN